MPDIMADIMAARPCDRPPEPLQRQEQGTVPSSPGTMTPDCPAPEGDARHSQATLRAFPLPKGAGQNDVWMKGTLRRRKPHLSSPKSAARLSWATLSCFIVAQGCSTALLGNTFVLYRRPRVQHGSLGQHFRTSSSPEGAARHAWATPPRVSAARRYWAKDVRLNLTKKRRSLPKKRGRLRSGAQSRARTGTSLRDIGF